MAVAALDHVSLPTDQLGAMIDFYRRLGFEALHEDAFATGQARYVALVQGEARLNLHPSTTWRDPATKLRAAGAIPGCGDLCFVWSGSIDELIAMIRAAGQRLEAGPVEREGGRNSGTGIGMSVYVRDPDDNLVEFIVYP